MQKKFAVIGAGRVGSAIAEALFYRGWKCLAVLALARKGGGLANEVDQKNSALLTN